ncbi:hypothetical protein CPB84DRAFT_1958011 [Gymnopilus junonius]|uniref:J domain-containing protein n=1 Tax=Gymnopilus junonius TaxID=109634 RepID=A0A9P5NX98_GYMJU|nr:hypothetical protein CPB84DRAFT_1958011 [Gymnopilus junonius]
MGTLNLFLSLFGWTIIPDFASKQLLNFVYHKSPIRIVAVPQLGSLQHRKHYATAFAFVIFTYLTYTLIQSARSMPPNFYQILGVPPNVDDNGLKLAFRAFAKRYHPDKPGVGKDGEALFMYVRDAFEALKDPPVRFAYDRFGPDVVGWHQHCKTTREFLRRGLMVSSGYHIVTGIVLLFWSAIGRPSSVSFWRYVLFAALFAGELSFILSPFPAASSSIKPLSPHLFSFLSSGSANALSLPTSFPTASFLETIFPNRIPYQHILFLHQLFMILSVALTRVIPQFLVLLRVGTDPNTKQLDAAERAIWEQVYASLAIADREASLILHTILRSITPSSSTSDKPYHDPTLARMQPLQPTQTAAALDTLTPEMHNLVTETNIKIQTVGPIASAWEAALRKAYSTRQSPAGSGSGNTPPATDQPTPQGHRTKNFWEKEADPAVDADIITLAGSESPSSSSRPVSRTPSTPRGRRSPSPSKAHSSSPMRRGSFGPGAGEI